MPKGDDTRFHPNRVIKKPAPPAGYGKYNDEGSNGEASPQREADRKFDQQEYERKQSEKN